jgi:hypothetical protein
MPFRAIVTALIAAPPMGNEMHHDRAFLRVPAVVQHQMQALIAANNVEAHSESVARDHADPIGTARQFRTRSPRTPDRVRTRGMSP